MEKQFEVTTHFEQRKGCNSTRRKTIMFGILVITFGVFWMMQSFNVLHPTLERAVFSWQAIVIAIGLVNLVNGTARWFGLFLLLLGAFFMSMRLDILPENWAAAFWPSLIILVGFIIIFSTRKLFRRKLHVSSGSNDYFEEVMIFAGSERKIVSRNFRGGQAISVFGGSQIDLTNCELAQGTHKIEVVSVFGGVKLIVPPDWNIKTEMVNVLGGFADKRSLDRVNPDKLIIIEGVAIFGGGELTNAI